MLESALSDLLRAARLSIVEGQHAFQRREFPIRATLARFYLKRARERLAKCQ